MTADPATTENVILLDDEDLFRELSRFLSSPEAAKELASPIIQMPSGGTGFTRSLRISIASTVFNFLLLNPDNAQPFAYLTLGQRTMRFHVPLVVCVARARSLELSLYPGDVTLVSEAVALPYPALYKNVDPHQAAPPERDIAESYQLDPTVAAMFSTFCESITQPQIWQKSIPAVRTGYAKHPAWRGGLQPWAPEQFQLLKDAGVATLSETPAGVYEVRRICPNAAIVCFNMIIGAADVPAQKEWNRRRQALLYPAMRLILDIIGNYHQLSTHLPQQAGRLNHS